MRSNQALRAGNWSKSMPWPCQLRSQGIDPTRMKVIGVKAAVAHQRAYNPIARASHFVETPGPCSSRLETFTFRHLARPVFPLDARTTIDSRT